MIRQLISHRTWKQTVFPVWVILLCVGAIAALQVPQLQQLLNRSQTASVEQLRRTDAAEKARLSLLQKLPSFGYSNLIADWAFLGFLQYFGDETARTKTDYTLSPEYFAVVLGRDPYFLQAYPFASTSTALYAGAPERSIALMKQGLESLQPNVPPGSYYAWRQLAIDQLLFLGDAQAAKQSFEMAADWALQSHLPDSAGVAESSRRTAAFLARNPLSKTAQVSAWTMVLGSAPDDRTQKTAISRIEALGSKVVKNSDGSFGILAPAVD